MRDAASASVPLLFNTDCEGPTVANDHALQVAERWIPSGDRLFRQLSRFDDFVAYVRQRPAYNAGDTLRLLLPFLKAYGLSDKVLKDSTRPRDVRWIKGAKAAISYLAKRKRLPVFEISASYAPFAAVVAAGLRIPSDRVYCTYFALDRYEMQGPERTRLKVLAEEIIALPDVPSLTRMDSSAEKDLSNRDRATLAKLEELIWGEIAEELPTARRMLREIRSMGGKEKASAIRDTMRRAGCVASQTFYVGDSITDVEAFRVLEQKEGVTIAFNGNQYAVETAQVSCWGDTSLVTALLADIFASHGKRGLISFAESGGQDRDMAVHSSEIYPKLGDRWGVGLRNAENQDEILELSRLYRTETREAAVADLS